MRMPGRFLAQGAATLLMTMPVVAHPLDRGMAIVDPRVIEELDRDFGVAQMLGLTEYSSTRRIDRIGPRRDTEGARSWCGADGTANPPCRECVDDQGSVTSAQ